MRRFSILLMLCCFTTDALGAIPKVEYRVQASAGAWRPLSLGDVRRTIEHKALEVLTKPGLMRLEKTPAKKKGEPPAAVVGDYVIEIQGRLLDEAQTHTVYLSFEPGLSADLPSLRASRSISLRGQKKGRMLTMIETSARLAAEQLLDSLETHLRRAQGNVRLTASPTKKGDPFEAKEKWPFEWSQVYVPSKGSGALRRRLFAKKHGPRMAAYRLLTSRVGEDAGARNVLEECALRHDDKNMRRMCLESLRGPSRYLPQTQRVVTEVYRRDSDSRVLREAGDQMSYFTGIGRQEAIQAWLEQVANGVVSEHVKKIGDLPNLDLAIRNCLFERGKKEKSRRTRKGCWDLFAPIRHERRVAIVWRFLQETDPGSPFYLDGAGKSEGRIGTDWQRGVEKVIELAPRWDSALEDILWRRYQRDMSSFAIRTLGDYGTPSAQLLDRLFEAFKTTGARSPLWGMRRMGKQSPEFRAAVKERLAELKVTGDFAKGEASERDIDRVLKEIERVEKKEAEKAKEANR